MDLAEVTDLGPMPDPTPPDVPELPFEETVTSDLSDLSDLPGPDVPETPVDTPIVPEASEEALDPGTDPDPEEPGDLGPPDVPVSPDVGMEVDACNTSCHDGPRPVLLVHGVNGSSKDFATMIQRLIADGWPADWIFPFDAQDPSWGCNKDNAAALQALAEKARKATCQSRIDVIAHSMGSISSRYWIKNLGGQDVVNTYVTLGGMHHGLSSPCWAPGFLGVCVWKELCKSGDFIAQLNADPATPGKLHWVSMYGTADETVPNESSQLDGAENIPFEGVEHSGAKGLQEVEAVYLEVRRVLAYPCW
jgi:triacylglycerol lipase